MVRASPLEYDNDTDSGIDQHESSAEDEDEGVDIEFPRESAADLMQFLHRELNNLQNMEDAQKRKFALIKMYQVLVQARRKAPNKIY